MEINKILEQLDQYADGELSNDDSAWDKLQFMELPPIDVLFNHSKNPYDTKKELCESIKELNKTIRLYREEMKDDPMFFMGLILALSDAYPEFSEDFRANMYLSWQEYVLNTYA